MSSIGKLKFILHNNRYFIQSTQLSLLQFVAKQLGSLKVNEPNPTDIIDPDTGFILPDDESVSIDISGRITYEIGIDTNSIQMDEQIARRFEVRSDKIQKVRKIILNDLQLPFSDEYDFRNDPSKNLGIDLKQATLIRPYQEKALSKMFAGGRAKSGIIVLPCGAGKTLVGITAACTINKSTIVFCDSNVSVAQSLIISLSF